VYVMAVLLCTGAMGSVCDNVMTVLLYAGDMDDCPVMYRRHCKCM
jgi:hypothetical protein